MDYLGLEERPDEIEAELSAIQLLEQDEVMGRIMRLIAETRDEKVYFDQVFQGVIKSEWGRLSSDRQLLIKDAHAAKKREFEAKKA